MGLDMRVRMVTGQSSTECRRSEHDRKLGFGRCRCLIRCYLNNLIRFYASRRETACRQCYVFSPPERMLVALVPIEAKT